MLFSFNTKTLLVSIFALVLLTSCSKEEESDYIENSLVNVNLVGTQTQLNRFNLEILEVQLKVLEDETNPNAWLSLNTINKGVHDLTNFNDNHAITLVDFEQVPADFIYNIKLVLGDRNTVVKNNVEYNIDLVSEYGNASVNVVEKQLVENKLYEFTIELDIDESIHFTSENEANLDPKTNTLMRLYNLF